VSRGNPWKTIGSRTVYQNPWLRVREDDVIRPDGNKGIYSVVEMRPSVGIVALREDGHVALVRQWRYVHEKMSVEIPTGGSEEGESVLDAAKRELREETGLTASNWLSLGSIDNSNGATTDVAHLFLASELVQGRSEQLADEDVELSWQPFDKAVESALNGEITESVTVAGLLKVKLLRA
jgi:8-oxo-dGTP pyrophosphatase MutT (NUDIX family)